ncbi:hypothetical protein [Methylobacterium nonmethylotrophicum]|uniref:DUF4440 domain-containing protein n=1 Tax=Methylobacterium nonmethylotrophicum TaxID=1141884 RepID=A0A4Z0NLK1_9HYPH|nr:hypothetical protein [Methylobacterium nonmethylotrophicum]TGD97132.1 hypothetical protein EU555_20420 [Methylobacterium nonmethylotrophicum]
MSALSRPSLSPSPAALLGLGLSALLSTGALAQGWVDPPTRAAAPPAAPPAAAPAPKAPRFEPAPAPRAEAPVHPKAHAPRRVAEEVRRPARSGIHAATEARRAARLARAVRPLPVQIPAPAPVAVSDDQMRDWAVASQRLARDYMASISGANGAMLAEAPGFYGSQVVFHGRPMSVASLMSEKRRFVQRWPERRYRPRPDSLRTACNAGLAVCRVQAMVDFSAFSPDRGVRSQGTVDVELAVSFAGGRPVIVSENSRVVRRDAMASRD